MNIPEILVANGTGAVLVSFLLLLRVRGESKNSVGTALFCRILVVTLLAQATETISFLLDGVPGADMEGVKLIGHITKPELGCALITRDGQEFELKAQGWNPLKNGGNTTEPAE